MRKKQRQIAIHEDTYQSLVEAKLSYYSEHRVMRTFDEVIRHALALDERSRRKRTEKE
jgi:predicted nucleotidyltransferase